MRIWIAIFSAALFAGGTCLGVALQPRLKPTPTPPPPAVPAIPRYDARYSVHRFESELGLADEQKDQLTQILDETQIILEEKGRDLRAAHDRSRTRVMEILTEDQKKKLDELLGAERQKRSEADADRTVKIYAKLLDLNPEQAKGFRDAVLEAKNKKRISYDSHKRGGDHDRTLSKAVRDEQNEAIRKAISPEQYQRYLEMSELER